MSAGVYLTREEIAALLSSTCLGALKFAEAAFEDGDAGIVLAAYAEARFSPTMKPRAGGMVEIVESFRDLNPTQDAWLRAADAVIASKPAPSVEVRRRCARCGAPYPAALLRAVDAEVAKAIPGESVACAVAMSASPFVQSIAACEAARADDEMRARLFVEAGGNPDGSSAARTVSRLSVPAGSAEGELAAFDATLSAEQRASLDAADRAAHGDPAAGPMTAEDAALLASKGMR